MSTIRERFEKLHAFGVPMCPGDSRALWLADVLAIADELDREGNDVRNNVFAELFAHCRRVGIDIVIDRDVMRAIENGICPNPESHAILRQWCSGCGGAMPCESCGRAEEKR